VRTERPHRVVSAVDTEEDRRVSPLPVEEDNTLVSRLRARLLSEGVTELRTVVVVEDSVDSLPSPRPRSTPTLASSALLPLLLPRASTSKNPPTPSRRRTVTPSTSSSLNSSSNSNRLAPPLPLSSVLSRHPSGAAPARRSVELADGRLPRSAMVVSAAMPGGTPAAPLAALSSNYPPLSSPSLPFPSRLISNFLRRSPFRRLFRVLILSPPFFDFAVFRILPPLFPFLPLSVDIRLYVPPSTLSPSLLSVCVCVCFVLCRRRRRRRPICPLSRELFLRQSCNASPRFLSPQCVPRERGVGRMGGRRGKRRTCFSGESTFLYFLSRSCSPASKAEERSTKRDNDSAEGGYSPTCMEEPAEKKRKTG
jgi:hypothetical protein